MPGLALKLVVGLGNPGADYARTRHNAGFWFVDELARRHGGAWRNEPRFGAHLARVRVGDSELWLVKPQRYMNLSGGVAVAVAGFYKIATGEILAVHDELDLPLGALRLKMSGGAGGHNGVRDLIAHLGEDFWRLRVGMGHPGARASVTPYLTEVAPSAAEQRVLDTAILDAADAMPLLLSQGAAVAMQRLHARPDNDQSR